MNTANYLQNRLLTKRTNIEVSITKEIGTKMRQYLAYIRMFNSKVNMHIPYQKRFKSDIYKIWNKIFIEYTDKTKHFY